MFNEFLNSDDNSNSPVNKRMLVNITRYLTNDERANLKKNLNMGKNIDAKMSGILRKKLDGVNLTALKMSPLTLGFFNAIVNGSFDKKERINLVSIFNKKPHARKRIPGTSIDIEIKNIKLYYGQFKVGAEHSLSGTFGEVDPKRSYFMVQISAHVYDGDADQGIMFRVYRNGKIHFSGGILNNNPDQPNKIRKYIVDTFTNREAFLYSPIVYNNTSGQFSVNGAINLPGVAQAFRQSGDVDYEPELRAALRMEYFGVSYQLFTSGVIQILGIKNDTEMTRGYDNAKEFAEQLYVMGLLRITKGKMKNTVTKKKQKKVVASNKNSTNVTYNANKNVIRISKKLCHGYLKPELVGIAKKLGIVNFKSTTTKAVICSMIKDKVFGGFSVDGKPCLGLTKTQLVPMAIARGVSVSDTDTVKSICDKLQKVPSPKAPAAKSAAPAKSAKNTMTKRRLTDETIKSNLMTLYGKKWLDTYKNVMPSLNENVAEIKRRMNAPSIKKNKTGVPFKTGVNALKKSTVREWKLARKSVLNNKLNTNLANELENLLNVEPTKKKSPKAKFLKGTRVEYL